MNENGRKKREWIKTAAIVFLSVMLVLTFFSRTIQNWALPEVATQYVQSGTITAKIRGTGIVESTDPYEVKVTETRKVASVAVRKGDTVQKGDVLIYLEGKDSEELERARQELESAQAAYDKALLNDRLTASEIQAAMQGVTAENYRKQITALQNEIREIEDSLKPIQNEIARIQLLMDDCNINVTYVQSLKSEASKRAADAKADYQEADTTIKQAQADFDNKKITQEAKDEIEEEWSGVRDQNYSVYVKEQDFVDQCDAVLSDLNGKLVIYKVDQYNAEKQKKQVEENLSDKNSALKDLLSTIGNVTSLESYIEAVNKAKEKVDELTEKASGTTITAPISGTIAQINVTAGNDTSAAIPVVVMQPEGRGYTLSFSVTNDQARRVSVGDVADLVNAWRYDNVIVTLASIRPDTANPGQNKVLTFDVTGNVTTGQTLTLSVGQKSSNYDFIVPNSAIREDNNGKFILIVQSKSSPLGTRYTASRVDVQVIAGDENQSAVSGALKGYEFVITHSKKPVEAGNLVRLPD